MVSKFGLVGNPRFESFFCNLFPICWFESLWRTLFSLFDSPCAVIKPYMREDVKGMIFILNSNPIRLSF